MQSAKKGRGIGAKKLHKMHKVGFRVGYLSQFFKKSSIDERVDIFHDFHDIGFPINLDTVAFAFKMHPYPRYSRKQCILTASTNYKVIFRVYCQTRNRRDY